MNRFFIADPQHINTKNFQSLYEYFEELKSPPILNKDRAEWMTAAGNYQPFKHLLRKEYDLLKDLSDLELFEFNVLDINIFQSARAEILGHLITHPMIVALPLPKSLMDVFMVLVRVNKETLLWNMAAAIQWINFWAPCIKKYNPRFVMVFSGSLIYARTLLELLKNRPPRCFVLESSFTGTDNYIEEKYEPIANNSNLRLAAYYRNLGNNESAEERDRSRNKAINKIITARNKNVTQPAANNAPLFTNNRSALLICGQVINDFSLIESNGTGINSLAFYKTLIQTLLDKTDLNIVFKAHPWERKKTNVHKAFTLEALALHFSVTETHLNPDGRLILLEDYNLKSIFKQVNYVAGINSQSLLEAAFEGFQPIQFGNAFFAEKGFTSDYHINAINTFIEDLNANCVPGKLGFIEYKSFETFITKAFQFSLVSAFPSGKSLLRTMFNITPPIPIIKPEDKPNPPAIRQSKPGAKPPANNVCSNRMLTPRTSAQKRKWQKFLRTPRKFFLDSKNTRTRWLYVFFPSFLFD